MQLKLTSVLQVLASQNRASEDYALRVRLLVHLIERFVYRVLDKAYKYASDAEDPVFMGKAGDFRENTKNIENH